MFLGDAGRNVQAQPHAGTVVRVLQRDALEGIEQQRFGFGWQLRAMVAHRDRHLLAVVRQRSSRWSRAGARRGAQMGVLRIDHPDVHEFITAKRTPGRWNNFNVSVGVSDEFIQAVQNNAPWELVHKARPGTALLALHLGFVMAFFLTLPYGKFAHGVFR
eukprot:gene3854-5516_t